MKFKDVYEAAEKVANEFTTEPVDVLLALVPNGVPVAVALNQNRDCLVRGVFFDRQTSTLNVDLSEIPTSARIWVVDDGVESGKAATATGQHLKQQGFEDIALVVPVCARDAAAQLRLLYKQVKALEQPLMTRALSWHYEQMPNVDISTATEMLKNLSR